MDRVIEMQVSGYQIRRGGEALGATGTGNAVLLRLFFDAAWEGLSKCAKFTDARGDGGITTQVELLTKNEDGSYTAAVPREAMAYEGTAELTLVGELTENGTVTKRLTTKPLALRVFASGADRKAQNTEPITATDKQQILAKVDAAEGYARGTANGEPVPERAEDNAKYYAEQAAAAASETEKRAAEALSHRDDAQDFAARASKFAAAAELSAEEVAKSLNQADACRYDAFASDTQTGAVVYTDIGADGIPLKSLCIHANAETPIRQITVRRLGKNLFDPSENAFAAGYVIKSDGAVESSAGYAVTKGYMPVLPNTDYVFSGRVVGRKTYNFVAFYDAQKQFLSRCDSGLGKSTQFKTPQNCRYIRYCVASGQLDNFPDAEIMLEIGKAASFYEAFAPEDFTVRFETAVRCITLDLLRGTGTDAAGKAFSFSPLTVTTKRGINSFCIPDGTGETLYAALRLDPTLVYEKLKTAIVAAGTT